MRNAEVHQGVETITWHDGQIVEHNEAIDDNRAKCVALPKT